MHEFNDVYQMVTDEATKLRDNVTKEEAAKLVFHKLFPAEESFCVYGLLTGNCFSPRSAELIAICAKPFSRWITRYKKSNSETFQYKTTGIGRYNFTAIEYYIMHADTQSKKNIIAYIRGEIETLELGKISVSGIL